MSDVKKTIGVRVTDEERAKHQHLADLKGVTLSQHLRGVLEMALNEQDRTMCMVRAYLQDQGIPVSAAPEKLLYGMAFLFQHMDTPEKVKAVFGGDDAQK